MRTEETCETCGHAATMHRPTCKVETFLNDADGYWLCECRAFSDESEVDEAEEARKFLDDHIKVIAVPIPKPKEA